MPDEPKATNSAPAPAGTSSSRRLIALSVLLAAAGAVVGWWWFRPHPHPQPPPPPPPLDESSPDDPAPYPTPGYVGAAACGECPAARLAEFSKTRHFRACWTPGQGPMPPGFSGEKASYTSQQPGIRFQFAQDGRDFVQTVLRDTPRGPLRQPLRIDLIYGSGGVADEVYFAWVGDQLRELPMAWLNTSHQWAEQPFNPLAPGDFTRTTTVRCVECHNTWVAHIPGTENRYRRDDMILGVTCEKCHGPGREHVEFHRTHPGKEAARAIVHPGHLSRD